MIRKTTIVTLALAATASFATWWRDCDADFYPRWNNEAYSRSLETGSPFTAISLINGDLLVWKSWTVPWGFHQEWAFAGIEFQAWDGYAGTSMIMVDCPLWPFVAGFAAYPTIAFIRGPFRRRRRRPKGLCVTCGYNLTGNLTGTCSECGTSQARTAVAWVIAPPPPPPA